jgi:hypothetical protein
MNTFRSAVVAIAAGCTAPDSSETSPTDTAIVDPAPCAASGDGSGPDWQVHSAGALGGYGTPFGCLDVQVEVFRDAASVSGFFAPYATSWGDYAGNLDPSSIDYDAHAVLAAFTSCPQTDHAMRVDAVVSQDDGALCVAVTVERPYGAADYPTMPWVLVTLPADDYLIGEVLVTEERATN